MRVDEHIAQLARFVEQNVVFFRTLVFDESQVRLLPMQPVLADCVTHPRSPAAPLVVVIRLIPHFVDIAVLGDAVVDQIKRVPWLVALEYGAGAFDRRVYGQLDAFRFLDESAIDEQLLVAADVPGAVRRLPSRGLRYGS